MRNTVGHKFDVGDKVVVVTPGFYEGKTAVVVKRVNPEGQDVGRVWISVPRYDIQLDEPVAHPILADQQNLWVWETSIELMMTPEVENALREGLIRLARRSAT